MTLEIINRFIFVSSGFPEEDTFQVVQFKGFESISKLYEFDITLVAEDPEVDLKEMLKNPATFTILSGELEYQFNGIISKFEQLQEVNQKIFYRAILVPRIWQADLYRDNQLFLEKSVEEIIEEVFIQAGLTANDFELRLTGTYTSWEYICQFRESDFDFISRWMERDGLYYYFEQTDNTDKIIITDSSTSHENVQGDTTIYYRTPTGMQSEEQGFISAFTCRQKMLPEKVLLKDYNYRMPTLDLSCEADVDATDGRGIVYTYGEHYKTPEEGNALAAIRAQELLCNEKIYYGESTAANLRAGYFFNLSDHYRDSNNQQYLITEVRHEGKQGAFLSGAEYDEIIDDGFESGYHNSFTAIPAEIQYRPERKTSKPRFYGTMNATVDASGDGEYAEIDDEGRYKVILPFDRSENSGGSASRWIRMTQPYAGANYGMHFPLHKGTEVILTFMDGDPDRPIIAGSVPNPDTMSPVAGGNQTQSMIRTGGGNQIRLEDSDGGQQIHLSSPTEKSIISLGAPNEGNIYISSAGDLVQKIIGPETHSTGGKAFWEYKGPYKKNIDGEAKYTYRNDVLRRTIGNTREEFIGTKFSKNLAAAHQISVGVKTSENLAATHELFVGIKKSENLAATFETFVGLKKSKSLAATDETFIGIKKSKCLALTISQNAGASFEITDVKKLNEAPINEIKGKTAIRLSCGGSGMSIFPDKIIIQAQKIVLDGPGATIETTSHVNIDGDTKIAGEATITKNCMVSKKIGARNFKSD